MCIRDSSSNQYTAPTLTHSQRLDLYQIDGWFPKTPEGIQKAFAYDETEFQPLWHGIDDHLEFVGYWIDHRLIEKIPRHPLFVNFSYFFRATKPFDEPYWLHMIFTNQTREEIYFYEKHIPTHNLLKPIDWPIGQVIKDHHIRGHANCQFTPVGNSHDFGGLHRQHGDSFLDRENIFFTDPPF